MQVTSPVVRRAAWFGSVGEFVAHDSTRSVRDLKHNAAVGSMSPRVFAHGAVAICRESESILLNLNLSMALSRHSLLHRPRRI